MALADQIIGVESGGNPNAQNPNSSAAGPGQFVDSTWLSMLKQHRPDITGSPQELLALKSDPDLSRQMTEAYASDNGAILSKAGLPVTPGNTYLAHFAGPQGAVSVLQADPSAPVASVLGPGVVKANPFLANMSAGDLQAWATRKMGGQGGSAPAASPQTPFRQPAQASPAGAFGGLLAMLNPQQAQAQQPIIAPTAPQAALSGGGSYFGQMPAEQAVPQLPPIFTPPRRPVDISKLRAALQASGNRGLFLGQG